MLKHAFKNWDTMMWAEFIRSRQEPVSGCRKHGDEPSGSLNDGKILV
jgi:hypothetical protein